MLDMLNILNIQDSNFADVLTLDEAFKSCIDANCTTSIYGAYAFVTKGGFDVMFSDVSQKKQIKNINLVIGMDGITNTACIEHLKKADSQLFDIKAYIPTTNAAIFHPKFCILANEDHSRGWLIIGSGNLTVRGIRKNQEAYTAIELFSSDLTDVIQTWDNWLGVTHQNLKRLDDDIVTTKAEKNSNMFRGSVKAKGSRKRAKERNKEIGKEAKKKDSQSIHENIYLDERKDFDGWSFNADSEVLIAEIPKASNRWNQANFNKATYLDYFAGSLKTSKKQVILRHVDPVSGWLDGIEHRPCVAVKSKNFRVELSAAAGLEYPKEGSPIAVFINVGKRTFIYSLFMPENDYYSTLKEWVNANWVNKGKRTDRKCRLTFPVHAHRKLLEPTKLFQYFEDEDLVSYDLFSIKSS
ncbi:phospholipase D family protein [Psychrobacter aquimaris]|uniref:phospholipase D family protein n=1 Tax=Psychrobacter aquimaris TaxID=292733 RepID=UPI003FD508AC